MGLCEIICNYILLADPSGKKNLLPSSAEELKVVEDTHILDVTNWFSRLMAIHFSIYPHNLFSNSLFAKSPFTLIKLSRDNNIVHVCVDKLMLSERFKQLPIGFTIKFFVFEKGYLSMNGHSMLIKKTSEDLYTFFDPNKGYQLNLDIEQLVVEINTASETYTATHITFIDARHFIDSHKINKKEIDNQALIAPLTMS